MTLSEFEALHTELIAFRGDMDQRFTAIRGDMDQRFTAIDSRLTTMDGRFASMDVKICWYRSAARQHRHRIHDLSGGVVDVGRRRCHHRRRGGRAQGDRRYSLTLR